MIFHTMADEDSITLMQKMREWWISHWKKIAVLASVLLLFSVVILLARTRNAKKCAEVSNMYMLAMKERRDGNITKSNEILISLVNGNHKGYRELSSMVLGGSYYPMDSGDPMYPVMYMRNAYACNSTSADLRGYDPQWKALADEMRFLKDLKDGKNVQERFQKLMSIGDELLAKRAIYECYGAGGSCGISDE